jgi:hypothetical protein
MKHYHNHYLALQSHSIEGELKVLGIAIRGLNQTPVVEVYQPNGTPYCIYKGKRVSRERALALLREQQKGLVRNLSD